MTYGNVCCNNQMFCRKSVIKNHIIYCFSTSIIYQLSTHHIQQYINYHCNFLYYCSLCLRNSTVIFSIYVKWLFKPVFIPLQTRTVHMCTHGCQIMVTETSRATNFWALFFYTANTFLYWLAILFIGITFFYWKVFQAGKETNENHLSSLFLL